MTMIPGRVLWLAAAVTLGACQQAPVDQSAEAASAAREADVAWEKAFSSFDTAAAVAAVEPTGSMLAPNAAIATGPDAIRTAVIGFFSLPNVSIHWQPAKAEGARSGDLAYTMGTYQLNFTDPKGQAVNDHGKYATVWRKQADGSWKVVVDAFNSDLPAPGT